MSLSAERRELLTALQAHVEGPGRLAPIERRSDPTRHQLTFSQAMSWHLHRTGGPCDFDHPKTSWVVRGPLDVNELAQAARDVVARHDVLRARFHESGGSVIQTVSDEEITFGLIDMSRADIETRRAEALEWIAAAVDAPFDLERDPMVRVCVAKLDREEHLAALAFHHIAFDGFSMPTFLEELWICYQARRAGKPLVLPEIRLQLADYAEWQRRLVCGPEGALQIAGWRRRLAGAAPLDLPVNRKRAPDRARAPFERHAPAVVHRERVPPETVDRIRRLALETHASPYAVWLAAVATVLGRRSRREDVVLMSPFGHRDREQTARMIGYMANPLLMRIDLSGEPSVRTLVARARRASLDAFSQPDLPLGCGRDVHPELPFDAPVAGPDFFRVSFNYLPMFQQESGPDELSLEPIGWDPRTTRIELVMFATELADGLDIFAVANAELYERETVAEICRSLADTAAAFE